MWVGWKDQAGKEGSLVLVEAVVGPKRRVGVKGR